MKVKTGHNVQVHYKGTFTDGTVFDESRTRGKTLEFQVGSGQMISGFNDAVVGMDEGETKTVTLTSENAYGAPNPEAFQTVPKEAFGEDFDFVLEGMIRGNGPQGPFVAKIHEIEEDSVVLDFKHPLAGKDLNFEIEVVSVKK